MFREIVSTGFSYRFNTDLVLATSVGSKAQVQISKNHKKSHTYQFQFVSLVIKSQQGLTSILKRWQIFKGLVGEFSLQNLISQCVGLQSSYDFGTDHSTVHLLWPERS